MNSPLLIDIGPLSCECSDHVLDEMHKALAGDDGDIWRPHESSFIRSLVERVSAKGSASLESLKLELMDWLGKKPEGPVVAKPVLGAVGKWTEPELGAVKAYLSGLPSELWSAGEYQLLVDYLVQRHWIDGQAIDTADYIARRSVLMGRVQAAASAITNEQALALMNHFADDHALLAAERLAKMNATIIDYGRARCAESIVSLTNFMRSRIKGVILNHQELVILGGGSPIAGPSLQSKLFDEFATLNRDWRRIAITEPGEMANQGFVSSMVAGSRLKRIEQYSGACPFCRKWDGKVFEVVPPTKKNKNWDTEIWTGKSNVGRSASPYKRVGGQLIKRLDAEMWKPSSGLFHPHCRGRWVKVGQGAEADEFSLWLDGFLAGLPKTKADVSIGSPVTA